ncbi:alpha-2-macroglobulin family protein [Roseococcus suduntuyensis]|uniref:Alpha-2-macroglobulin family protein n=1 Tax=Roseococcus suduntuyensis TaxID=455361 RepID=A0A840AF19_9PROT|nr:alpha-2-macroglobulin [Roseococcus suduntuyensis]MBB3899073.1 hypothetical protein [Roseococcus suduntuyensis]
MFRRLFLLFLLAFTLPALPLAAQGFEIPGLWQDSQRYRDELERRHPAGGTAAQRQAAESRAATAQRQNNWAAAAEAWEARVALGQATPEQWLALARAQLRRTPPDGVRALRAAWQNFIEVPGGAPEIPSLLVMADALAAQNRPLPRLAALEAVLQRDPGNPAHQQALAAARREVGVLVRRLNTEPDAEPARACLGFTTPPARRDDWRPEDWLRAEPALPGLGFTRERDSICILGLPLGRSTRVILRAGMPGEDGLRVNQDQVLNIAMPDRAPRLAFDPGHYLMPRDRAEARVPMALMNISAIEMRVIRLTERSLIPFSREARLGEAISGWTAGYLHEEWGQVVWEGAIELPRGEANRFQRLSVPLPDAVRTAGPGLYIMVARPADGARDSRGLTAAQPLIVTDLGLSAWRGAGGLAAQVRGLASAAPREGVRVALMARNNDILAEVTTGPDGLARFNAPLLRGEGPMAPVALHAMTEDDLVTLNLEAASFDLSDRGVAGRAHPGPLDAFLWLDRGIYRPGETVQAMALLRDVGGAPSDAPLRLRLRRPNGQVLAEQVVRDGGHWPVALPLGAQAGAWTLEAVTDPNAPPVGQLTFRVEAFVAERLAVEAGPAPGPLRPGQPLDIPVTARFLYGAPGSGLSGSAELRLTTQRSPFAQWPDFRFGLEDETFAPDLIPAELPETDADGRATLRLELPSAPDTTRPLRGEVTVLVEEPGGRASRATLDLAMAAQPRFLGLNAPAAVDAGAEAAVQVIMTDAEGNPLAGEVNLRLVRERPDWRIVVRGGTPRYETVWTDEPVDSTPIRLTGTEPARFTRTLPFGRYRLEAQEAGGMALASIRFRAGWVASESAEVPDRVDVATDRASYAPGETITLRVTPPFAGRAAVAVLTDRLLSLREMEVPEAGAEITLPADAAWGAGAYVAVTVFRPEAGPQLPGRALGLAWVQMAPDSRALAVTLDAPDRVRPNTRLDLPVTVAGASGPVRLTLAAVDEGILRLTRFASPDPLTHYMGRRTLGVDIRDDYGRLIAPPEGAPVTLRQGGDDMDGLANLTPPQRNVALFSGVVETDAQGRAVIPLDLPDFAGELRLMAVAWAEARVGAASRPLTVRDPLLAEPLLPRFLAPGDEADAALLLHNLELPAGEVVVNLTAEGALALRGEARITTRMEAGARAQPPLPLSAVAPGEGVLRLSVTGPGGFTATREARITVRSSRPIATALSTLDIAPGAEARLAPDARAFLPGWRAVARLGSPVRYDAAGMLAALQAFPLACLEQVSSQAIGMAAAMNEGSPVRDAVALQRAVDGILARQRFDGSFGLWSAQGEPQYWTSAYAVEALLRARAAGATVPEAPLQAALADLEERLEQSPSEPTQFAAQAARLNALSLAGRHRLGAARRLLEVAPRLPTPLARAQLAASFARAGDAERANAAFAEALALTDRRDWLYDYGSAARDALALVVLAREAGLPAAQISAAAARLPGPELTPARASTQEQAWAVLAAVTLGQDARPVRAAWNGSATEARVLDVTGGGVLRNAGEAPLPVQVAISGTPAQAAPAGRQQMTIRRRFLALDGQALNLDTMRPGVEFLLVLDARAESGQEHMAMLTQGLPAGWEIVTRLAPGPVPGQPDLGPLTEVDAMPALDDRLAAALTFTREAREARIAARIRVVTPGRFELPGAEVVDMYRPAFFARQNAARITVNP